MRCDDLRELVEPVAAGEVRLNADADLHLASCAGCAAALAHARQLESMLKDRPAPGAPAGFTTRTLTRLRLDRWRREQFLDAGFNLAVALVGAGITTGALLLAYTSGLTVVGHDVVGVLESAATQLLQRVAPSLPLYAGAVALMATALAIWWWAERDLSI